MKRNYTTQMNAAKQGIATKEMLIVAEKEGMAMETLLALVAKGQIVIPANKYHTSLDPEGVGTGLKTKINVNLGISKDANDLDVGI